MPYTAITYDIKGGCEDQVAAVFQNFKRPRTNLVAGAEGEPAGRILATAVFIRDSTLVRVIEYEGDLDAVIRFMAGQPGVAEVERKLAPYLNKPRDTGTVEGFLDTFHASQLRCITEFAVPRQ